MTSLKYRKLSIILGYIQAIICSFLLGLVIKYTVSGGLNLGTSILSMIALVFLIVKSYIEVIRNGTKIRTFAINVFTIHPNAEPWYQCLWLSLTCFTCVIYPFMNIHPSDIVCIICLIPCIIIGVCLSMPNRYDTRILKGVEALQKSTKPAPKKTISDIQNSVKNDLLDAFSPN